MSKHSFLLPAIAFLLAVTYIAVWQINLKNNSQVQVQKNNNSEINNQESFPLLEPGLFKIDIPEKFDYPPRRTSSEIRDSSGNFSASLTIFSYDLAENSYQVGFVRYPNEVFQKNSTDNLLQNLRDGQIKDYRAILLKESTSYDAHNIVRRELEMRADMIGEKLFIRSSIIISEPFVFVISFTARTQEDLYKTKAQKFFDSFRLFRQESNRTVVVGSD